MKAKDYFGFYYIKKNLFNDLYKNRIKYEDYENRIIRYCILTNLKKKLEYFKYTLIIDTMFNIIDSNIKKINIIPLNIFHKYYQDFIDPKIKINLILYNKNLFDLYFLNKTIHLYNIIEINKLRLLLKIAKNDKSIKIKIHIKLYMELKEYKYNEIKDILELMWIENIKFY